MRELEKSQRFGMWDGRWGGGGESSELAKVGMGVRPNFAPWTTIHKIHPQERAGGFF